MFNVQQLLQCSFFAHYPDDVTLHETTVVVNLGEVLLAFFDANHHTAVGAADAALSQRFADKGTVGRDNELA